MDFNRFVNTNDRCHVTVVILQSQDVISYTSRQDVITDKINISDLHDSEPNYYTSEVIEGAFAPVRSSW
ncbi:hypothetical protein F927_01510 [Acinetobacter haemolyticus CIP 64.3 = MTCC 9819]|uniref:Uncharacterized protein n=1 Tax=Acinetobacter haemolyticus CIP 64.3 = MTCC 9819 TaxID=1217659 RepID=N9F7A7_ACIHA|nr:hypothetical protein F927_01510 [Acinetobacter haemolyticus CIP 64.3 = MTCC 9819]